MPTWAMTRDLTLALIQEDKRPPSWRWHTIACHDGPIRGLWEWQADTSREATVLGVR